MGNKNTETNQIYSWLSNYADNLKSKSTQAVNTGLTSSSKTAATTANASSSNTQTANTSNNPDGTVGIRETLNKMGFSDKSIGYNEADGSVTLNGKRLMTPQYVDEDKGISYSSAADIQKSLTDYFADSSNPIVMVSDAYSAIAGSYGLSADGLSYGNGTVMIGGTPLNILYTDDSGKAWAWKNDVEDLTRSYIKSVGAKSPSYLSDKYEDQYLSEVWDAIDALRNREEFSYDPETDPVYQAYEKMYLREGNRATEDAMAKYSALTGGYANSSAVTAAGLASNYYASKLTDAIPTLAAAAYERYLDSYENELSALDRMLDTYYAAYNSAADANNRTVSNVNSVLQSNVNRDNAAYNRNKDITETQWQNAFNSQAYDLNEREGYWSEILNGQEKDLNNEKLLSYQTDRTTSQLENREKEIFLEYYNRLLDAQLTGDELSNSLSSAKLNAMYGY